MLRSNKTPLVQAVSFRKKKNNSRKQSFISIPAVFTKGCSSLPVRLGFLKVGPAPQKAQFFWSFLVGFMYLKTSFFFLGGGCVGLIVGYLYLYV